MAKLPMKKRLPSVNVKANLLGLIRIVGIPIKNASAKNRTDKSNATTKPCMPHAGLRGGGGGVRGITLTPTIFYETCSLGL